MTRLMAKVFEVEVAEKGSPLQSKINAFTKGKNIERVHDLAVSRNGNTVRATLIYDQGDGEGAPENRLFAKVLQDVPVGSELQTKVNSFTKDKDYGFQLARVAHSGDTATVVLLHTKPGGGDSSE